MILVGGRLTSYINIYPFIYYSKGVTQFILFLLRLATEPVFWNFGDSNGDKGNLRPKSANVHNITSLMYILDRESLLLWKGKNVHVRAHAHTYLRWFAQSVVLGFPTAIVRQETLQSKFALLQ